MMEMLVNALYLSTDEAITLFVKAPILKDKSMVWAEEGTIDGNRDKLLQIWDIFVFGLRKHSNSIYFYSSAFNQ